MTWSGLQALVSTSGRGIRTGTKDIAEAAQEMEQLDQLLKQQQR